MAVAAIQGEGRVAHQLHEGEEGEAEEDEELQLEAALHHLIQMGEMFYVLVPLSQHCIVQLFALQNNDDR